MKRYQTYKDSGVEWIGEIPAHWSALRLKWVCNFLYGESLSAQEREDGIIPVYGSNGIVGYHNRSITEKPCIIVGRKGSFGKVTFSEKKCYPIDTTYYIDCTSTKNYMRWLWYLLPLLKMDEFSRDSAVPGLNREDAYRNIVTLPSSYEQQQIAAYLDRKTTQIDDLISKKQKLIELLKEERSAIINQAVTKGLNPDAPMKDSGIERLGEIPAHWEIKKIKYLLKNKKGALKTGPFGSQLKNSDLSSKGFKVYNQRSVLDKDFDSGDSFISNEKFLELRDFEVFPGDLLLTSRGTIGKCAIFPSKKIRGILHPCLIRIQFDHDLIINDYAELFIQNSRLFAESIAFNSNATTIAVIYGHTLRDVDLVFPPNIKEQNGIVMFIEKQTIKIDQTISKIEKQIDLLKEFRTALISEVVTGKIDVRDEESNG